MALLIQVVVFSGEGKEEVLELTGKLGFTEIGKGLMHSVIEAEEEAEDGRLIKESINQSFGGFVPDVIYEQFVNNYSHAEQLYGKTFVNLISGYDADYVGKNVKIPEFQRELKKNILEKAEKLRSEGLIDENYRVTEKGLQLAALVLYVEELDALASKNLLGEKLSTQTSAYGEKSDTHTFRKGDRYRDIALKRSVKRALRRRHRTLAFADLESHERKQHGAVYIIYGIDASGSMKGKKIDVAKKAGVALAFAALERKDKVGVVVFSKEVKEFVAPTNDFGLLLRAIAAVRAAHETDIVSLIRKAVELFPREEATKHLILLSDALPTVGVEPERETLDAVARAHGITLSVVGINLDKKGSAFAQKLASVGQGRFYLVKNVEDVDRIVLEDYYGLG